MAMNFKELDTPTREHMLAAFEAEEAGGPYRSQVLSAAGLAAFPELMRDAIQSGDESTLGAALARDDFWEERDGGGRTVNVRQSAERLALTEFNTWYVAGLARRLQSEGETECQVYRAANPKWEHASCSTHEGQRYPLADVTAGHRAGYWPPPGDPGAFSIPAGPGCHHTIRRITKAP